MHIVSHKKVSPPKNCLRIQQWVQPFFCRHEWRPKNVCRHSVTVRFGKMWILQQSYIKCGKIGSNCVWLLWNLRVGQNARTSPHEDLCSLHLPVLVIHAHPSASRVLMSCRRPLPRALLQYLVSRSVQLRIPITSNYLCFFLPHIKGNHHIYMFAGTASVDPDVYGRTLDWTQPVLEAFVCLPAPLGDAWLYKSRIGNELLPHAVCLST